MGQAAITVTALFSLFLLFPLSYAAQIRYCDKNADYELKIHEVKISPDPIARGTAISAGKLDIDVAYFGWHVYSETHDLCTETSCPVSTGDFVISHSQVLPAFTPPGSYSLKMKILDTSKHQLSCFDFDFSIGFGSSVAAI